MIQTLEIARFVVKNRQVRRRMAFHFEIAHSLSKIAVFVGKLRTSFSNHRNRRLTTKRSSKSAVFVGTFVVKNRRVRRQGFVAVFVVRKPPKSPDSSSKIAEFVGKVSYSQVREVNRIDGLYGA